MNLLVRRQVTQNSSLEHRDNDATKRWTFCIDLCLFLARIKSPYCQYIFPRSYYYFLKYAAGSLLDRRSHLLPNDKFWSHLPSSCAGADRKRNQTSAGFPLMCLMYNFKLQTNKKNTHTHVWKGIFSHVMTWRANGSTTSLKKCSVRAIMRGETGERREKPALLLHNLTRGLFAAVSFKTPLPFHKTLQWKPGFCRLHC